MQAEVGAWQLYIILCSDQSLYTGITTDVKRRFSQHLSGKGGARYFRGRKPLRVVHLEAFSDRASASRREYAVKQLSRQSKLGLLNQPEQADVLGIEIRRNAD